MCPGGTATSEQQLTVHERERDLFTDSWAVAGTQSQMVRDATFGAVWRNGIRC